MAVPAAGPSSANRLRLGKNPELQQIQRYQAPSSTAFDEADEKSGLAGHHSETQAIHLARQTIFSPQEPNKGKTTRRFRKLPDLADSYDDTV